MIQIVKFSKPNCPHCNVFSPIFTKTIASFKDQIEFFEVDISQAPFMISIFDIKGVPALYTFKSNDFKDFSNIQQLTIGHSHENYKDLLPTLKSLLSS